MRIYTIVDFVGDVSVCENADILYQNLHSDTFWKDDAKCALNDDTRQEFIDYAKSLAPGKKIHFCDPYTPETVEVHLICSNLLTEKETN